MEKSVWRQHGAGLETEAGTSLSTVSGRNRRGKKKFSSSALSFCGGFCATQQITTNAEAHNHTHLLPHVSVGSETWVYTGFLLIASLGSGQDISFQIPARAQGPLLSSLSELAEFSSGGCRTEISAFLPSVSRGGSQLLEASPPLCLVPPLAVLNKAI